MLNQIVFIFLICIIGVWQQQGENDIDESFDDEGGGDGGSFDVYFTCEGIQDWRVEKICKYMHQADDYIRSHPPVVPPKPGTIIEEPAEEEQPPAAGGAVGMAGSAPASAIGLCPQTGQSKSNNAYGDEAGTGNVGGTGNCPMGTQGNGTTAIGGKKTVKKTVPFNPLDCATLECLCNYMDDEKCSANKMLKKVVRREYRLLSDEERKKFHNGLNTLKQNGIYNKLVIVHQSFSNESAGAHFGPAFLPWHREYNKRMEFALRMLDPDAALPFWDSTIEDALPRPNDSMLFTDELMGSTDKDGHVLGDFSTWTRADTNERLTRKVGQFSATIDPKNSSAGVGKPMGEIDINRILGGPNLEYLLAYSSPKNMCGPVVRIMKKYNSTGAGFNFTYILEYPHNYVHQFIGGHMGDTPISSNDPIFFLHHPFMDNLWEMYRQRYQTRAQRESVYPEDDEGCSNIYHFREHQMLPFYGMDQPDIVRTIRNIDGLSNVYTDQLYEYGPRPSCQMGPNCGSKYLFCDRSQGRERCVARIKLGGICKGFENTEICYQGECVNGLCVGQGKQTTIMPMPSSSSPSSAQQQQFPQQINTQTQGPPSPVQMGKQSSPARINPQIGTQFPQNPTQIVPTQNSQQIPQTIQNNNKLPQKQQQKQNYVDDVVANLLSADSKHSSPNSVWTTPTNNNFRSKLSLSPPNTAKNQFNPNGNNAFGNRQNQCFNHYTCCGIWAQQGECERNPSFMLRGCRASCRLCVPNYDLNIECSDRMRDCFVSVAAGACRSNWRFMSENCRKSCSFCGKTRAEECRPFTSKFSTAAFTTKVNPMKGYKKHRKTNKILQMK